METPRRLMSNRDHLEALIFAIANMSTDAELASTPSLLRVLATAETAKRDLYPQ